MPELHQLTPMLSILQNQGFKVALVTDGRMSGASGKVPAAIHLSPEAVEGGAIGKIKDGDIITLDAENGVLKLELSALDLEKRKLIDPTFDSFGCGRELFSSLRASISPSTQGATIFNY